MTAPVSGRWLAAVGAVVTLISLCGIGARAAYGARTTADEPQYLLTASSLADDRDLDISNQLDARSYLPYHEITVDTQTRVLDESGRRVSPHDPLLPVLLTVPMAIGGWVGAKSALAVVAGLTAALTVWIADRRFAVDRTTATVVVIGCFAGLPLAAYGTQVYPEMPAALLVTIAVAVLTAAPDRLGLGSVTLTMIAIVGLPWLAVKYVPVAAAVGLALLIGTRRRPGLVFGIVAVAVAAGAVYLGVHQAIYGGWTVYASGDHFESTGEFAVVGTDVNMLGRSRRLIGLLVDRRFGIGVWSPIWFLVPPALVAAVRAARESDAELDRDDLKPHVWLCVAVVVVGWLNATYVALTMHGWWVAGRQLVVVLPIAAVLVAQWAALDRRRLLATGLLGVIGVSNWLWLAAESTIGRRTLVIDFAETVAPFYRVLSPLFPDGTTGGGADDVGLLAWTVFVVGGALVAGRSTLTEPADQPGGGLIDDSERDIPGSVRNSN